ncbi:glycosyltransferase family 4 protein [Vibrio sp. ZSDE26]|uniref:Glycosyltransferase family 4 protein n=1 Tax=Vibrio amylolyticus TaxID=2847292 RepID=A0A9X1XL47_9VIBR|nr:glycosyltransferase family 4 protein [Vibrio amylolyticus]MCK6264947.1 glycosyltransferase family 4 protein [Vibrio amylolyticus]
MNVAPCKPKTLKDSQHKVWLLIDSLTFGGIETHVLELAKGLNEFGVDVSVVFTSYYGKQALLAEKIGEMGVQYFYLDIAFPSDHSFNSLKQAIKVHEPSLIHAHGYKASIYSKLAKLLTTKSSFKQLTTFHAGETPKGKVWLYDFVDRYSSWLSNDRLSVSQLIQNKLPKHSHRLNNFIDTQHVQRSKGTKIAFVGRVSHEKAPDRFVSLARLNTECEFHCYGSGPMLEELKKDAPENIVFYGYQNDMVPVWGEIELLILPSRYEGLPMAALESMARGIPLLCTRVGDLDTLVEHQINGFIADNENELNHYLAEWLSMNKTEKLKLQQAAIQTIEQNYSTQSVLPKLLEIYQI